MCWGVRKVRGETGGCEQVLGEVWESALGCGRGRGKCGGSVEVLEKMREGVLGCGGGKGRCGGKCGECGKVLGEVWKGEMWGELWGGGEVLGKVGESVLECEGGRRDVDVGKCVGVRGRCGEVLGEVWGSVLEWGEVWGCREMLGKVREKVLGCGMRDVGGSVGDVKKCWERCGKGKCG